MTICQYYDDHAASFIARTRAADLSGPRARFLSAAPPGAGGAARILDAGSRSGRDALAFCRLGDRVAAFDASPAMAAAPRRHAGVPARQMRFDVCCWEHPFEVIWACVSLLHAGLVDLSAVVCRMAEHLTAGGALSMSFKLGAGERREASRVFMDLTDAGARALVDGRPLLCRPGVWLSQDMRADAAGTKWINALAVQA